MSLSAFRDETMAEAQLPTVMSKRQIEQLGSRANERVSAPVSDFARRQLEKFGWKDGQGLGKEGKGMVSHVAVEKKIDSQGIGAEAVSAEEEVKAASWWHDAYASKLANIEVDSDSDSDDGDDKKRRKKKDKKNKKKKRDKPSSSSSSSSSAGVGESGEIVMPTFEELFAATGGARLGMRAHAGRRQNGKFERAEKGVTGGAAAALAESMQRKEEKEKRRKLKKRSAATDSSSSSSSSSSASASSTAAESAPKRPRTRSMDAADDEQATARSASSPKKEKKKSKKAKKAKK